MTPLGKLVCEGKAVQQNAHLKVQLYGIYIFNPLEKFFKYY